MLDKECISNAKILIVDDQEINVRILQSMLQKAGYHNITVLTDSTKAVASYEDIKPDLFILDLVMPEVTGFDIMDELRMLHEHTYLPVLVISNEENQEVRYRALESGAKDFLNKPYDRIEVLKRIHNLIEVRMLHNQIKDQNTILEQKVRERTRELYESQVDVIQRLARAIEYRDLETGMHILRMSHYAACLARSYGLSDEECDSILRAAPLHDIGKIGIPDRILQKPGKLTPEEWELMKTHTTIGGKLLSGNHSQFMSVAQEIALTHHERWDGKGYPGGLAEENIPVVGRICCLSDVFDALTTARPYKDAWPVEAAVDEIKRQRGKMFDPRLVDCFVSNLAGFKEIRQRYSDFDDRS